LISLAGYDPAMIPRFSGVVSCSYPATTPVGTGSNALAGYDPATVAHLIGPQES